MHTVTHLCVCVCVRLYCKTAWTFSVATFRSCKSSKKKYAVKRKNEWTNERNKERKAKRYGKREIHSSLFYWRQNLNPSTLLLTKHDFCDNFSLLLPLRLLFAFTFIRCLFRHNKKKSNLNHFFPRQIAMLPIFYNSIRDSNLNAITLQ